MIHTRFTAQLAAALVLTLPAAQALASGEHGHAFGHAGKPGEVDRTVQVEASDTAYDREQISVEPGETVRFVVKNTGSMRHAFAIGPADFQKAHRKEMREMMRGGGDGMRHDDPNAVMVEPGETAEVIWRFDRVQEIEFACNVPGHYQAGMKGDFVRP